MRDNVADPLGAVLNELMDRVDPTIRTACATVDHLEIRSTRNARFSMGVTALSRG